MDKKLEDKDKKLEEERNILLKKLEEKDKKLEEKDAALMSIIREKDAKLEESNREKMEFAFNLLNGSKVHNKVRVKPLMNKKREEGEEGPGERVTLALVSNSIDNEIEEDEKEEIGESPSLLGFLWQAAKIKAYIFSRELVFCFFTFVLLLILLEKDWGVIPNIVNTTKTHYFFVILVTILIVGHINIYFIYQKSLFDAMEASCDILCAGFTILYAIAFRLLCSSITGFQSDESNFTARPSASDKVLMYLFFMVVFFLEMFTGGTLISWIWFKLQPSNPWFTQDDYYKGRRV